MDGTPEPRIGPPEASPPPRSPPRRTCGPASPRVPGAEGTVPAGGRGTAVWTSASPNLEAAEATTIGGYLSAKLGRLPVVGDTVGAGDYQIEVTEADERRVKEVAFVRKAKSEGESSA